MLECCEQGKPFLRVVGVVVPVVVQRKDESKKIQVGRKAQSGHFCWQDRPRQGIEDTREVPLVGGNGQTPAIVPHQKKPTAN